VKPTLENCGAFAPGSQQSGFAAIEFLFVAAVVATLAGITVPPVLRALDDYRAVGAARYVAARLQRARMEAVLRSTAVALRFSLTAAGFEFATFVDGNGDGVLAYDISRSVDWRLGSPERLGDNFSGVDFGTEPGLPPVDTGGTPPGTDPIRLGSSDMASFAPAGSSSTGSLYIRGRTKQLVVRIYGDTGKTRILVFDPNTRQWKPL
jgi:type II secretory pathway pseudopilin PulG